MSTSIKAGFIAAATLALGLFGATAAHARSDVVFSVGISAPVPVYGAPATVYAPAPVYVQPRPVYVEPRPVYVAPREVYVRRGYDYYGYDQERARREAWRRWHRHHDRDGDWRGDRGDWRY